MRRAGGVAIRHTNKGSRVFLGIFGRTVLSDVSMENVLQGPAKGQVRTSGAGLRACWHLLPHHLTLTPGNALGPAVRRKPTTQSVFTLPEHPDREGRWSGRPSLPTPEPVSPRYNVFSLTAETMAFF